MRRMFLAFLLILSLSVIAAAQTSQLSGVVTDPSGGVIPGATLEIENLATGLKRTVASDAAGSYAFLQLAPGTYRLVAKAAGFRTVTFNEVPVLVNNPVTIPVRMEIGQVTEVVIVGTETEHLNTVDSSIGNAVSNKPIVQLPLNARNIVGLLALQPGVVFTSESDTDSRNGAVNGGKSDQANVTLDGVDVNDQMDRNAFTSVLRMTPDAVQEFRVTTLNANADQGRSSGAQVVLVTKRGTNEFHGSLYEYHRNTVTTANDFFLNMTLKPDPQTGKAPRPKLIRNIFGASAGGPIIKDRLFMFATWEGRRDARDGQATRLVPSLFMRQGTVQYANKAGGISTITPADIAAKLDPRGVNQAALRDLAKVPAPNDSTQGDGLNILGYRFTAPTPLRWNTYIARIDYALDSKNNHEIFVRGNLQNDNEQGMPQFPGQPANSVTLINNKGIAVNMTSVFKPTLISNFRYGLTRQGRETTGIANYSAVTFRNIDSYVGLSRPFIAIIPVHTIGEDVNWVHGSHNVQFGGIVRLNQNQRSNYANSYHSAVTNASWLVGSGSPLTAPFPDIAGSPTMVRYALTAVMGLVTQGTAQYNYKVDGTVLNNGDAVFRNFKNSEYELYVQDTWKVNRGLTMTAGIRWSLMPPIYEANGQQVSPNVPIGDWFNLRGSLAAQGKSQMEAGRLSYIPKDKGGRDLYAFHKKDFAPRLSLAYSPQGSSGLSKWLFGGPGKSVIRAGWGMYYDLFGSGLMRSYDATAFGLSNSLSNPSAQLTIATSPRYTSITEIPAGLLPAAPPATFPATYPDLFSITNGLDDTLKAPYSMTMNLSWGREFSGGWFVQASFIGRQSRRSLIRRDAAMPTNLKDPKSGMTYFEAATILARQVNAGVPTENVQKVPFWENLWSKAATSKLTATQVAYNNFVGNQYDWTSALYVMDTTRGGCVRYGECSDLGPYAFYHPQYSYLSVFSSVGGGNYYGGQLNIRKRFSNGDTLDFNYTLSKSIDLRSNTERAGSSSGVLWNPWNPGLMKGVSDYDNTHMFNMMGVYNLPFGIGSRYGAAMPAWADAFVGGWQLSGMFRMSSGFSISVYETSLWPTNWNNNNWAVSKGGTVETAHVNNMKGVDGKVSPGLFADPKKALDNFDFEMPGGIGTRNPFRGDGVFIIDLGVSKRFKMPYKEGHSIQFRWETFNLTNTAKFDVNQASLDISVSQTFGKYSGMLGQPRVMQFGLRYEW